MSSMPKAKFIRVIPYNLKLYAEIAAQVCTDRPGDLISFEQIKRDMEDSAGHHLTDDQVRRGIKYADLEVVQAYKIKSSL